jgi:hypothetical protein
LYQIKTQGMCLDHISHPPDDHSDIFLCALSFWAYVINIIYVTNLASKVLFHQQFIFGVSIGIDHLSIFKKREQK